MQMRIVRLGAGTSEPAPGQQLGRTQNGGRKRPHTLSSNKASGNRHGLHVHQVSSRRHCLRVCQAAQLQCRAQCRQH